MHAPRLAGTRLLAFAPLVGLVAIDGGCSRRPRVGGRPDAGPAVVVVERKAPPPRKPGPAREPAAPVVFVDEQEPNDEPARAQPIEFPKGIRGSLGGPSAPAPTAATGRRPDRPEAPDVDVFQWLVGGEPARQIARIELQGPPETHLALDALDGDGRVVASGEPAEAGLVVISNLAVDVGHTSYFRVRERSGARGDRARQGAASVVAYNLPYTLVVRASPLQPGDEVEPNDTAAHANALVAGVDETGYFGRTHDEDWLRLPTDVADGCSLRVELATPEGVAAAVRVRDPKGAALAEAHAAKGEAVRMRNVPLVPGALIGLRADAGHNTDVRWRLRLSVETLVAGAEREPNDTVAKANRFDLPPGATGSVAAFLWPGDVDVYRFHSEAAGTLRFQAIPPAGVGPGSEQVDVKLEQLSESGAVLATVDGSHPSAAAGGKPHGTVRRLFVSARAGGDILIRLSARPHDTTFDAPYTLGWSFVTPSPDEATPSQ